MNNSLNLTAIASVAFMVASTATADTASYALNGASGLIDMPTAQMLPDGETAWTFSGSGTAYGGTFTFQLLPKLETNVHYTTIDNWLGGEPLYDQSLDLKYQLFDETEFMPSLAIGFRDFLSNGSFSSEYIVASKNVGNGFTVTGGLGWGRLGSHNPISQPFGVRPAAYGTGIDSDQFFRGDMAVFGGVEWDTPIKGVSLKAEYSSDAYVGEQDFSGFVPKSPFNFGVEYEPVRGVSVGGYYNYGTDFGIRLTLSGNPNRPVVSPDLGIGPAPVNPRPEGYSTDGGWANNPLAITALMAGLSPIFEAEGLVIEEAQMSHDTLELYVDNRNMPQTSKAIGRIVRSLSVALPHSVEYFRITPVTGGLATATAVIKRSDLEAQVDRPNAGPDSWKTTKFEDAPNHLGPNAWTRDVYPDLSWSLTPQFPINLAGNGSAAGIDVLIAANAKYQINHNLSLNGSVSQKIYGTNSEVAVPSESDTPVRSNFALYDNGGPSVDRLTADYSFKLSPATYARVSAGYLERMFAGVTGEVLWMPANQNWGLGAEVSAVRQRAYDDLFGFEDYETVTSHASLYWDTGFHGIEAQIDVGTYLASDFGSTVTLTRRFSNGWEVSGFVTITDMPFDEYGDGNFSKGISVSIPLRWTLPMETRSAIGTELKNSGGDGGARLELGDRLYDTIRDYDVVDFNETWGAFWQ